VKTGRQIQTKTVFNGDSILIYNNIAHVAVADLPWEVPSVPKSGLALTGVAQIHSQLSSPTSRIVSNKRDFARGSSPRIGI
jgi:hypothetical protein